MRTPLMYYQTYYTYALPTVELNSQKQELESNADATSHTP